MRLLHRPQVPLQVQVILALQNIVYCPYCQICICYGADVTLLWTPLRHYMNTKRVQVAIPGRLNFEDVITSKMEEFGIKGDYIPKGMEVYCVLQSLEEDIQVVLLAKTKCRMVCSGVSACQNQACCWVASGAKI